jgi:hypothetical protein
MEEMRSASKFLVKSPEGDHFGDPGIDGMIILKWILKTWYADVD